MCRVRVLEVAVLLWVMPGSRAQDAVCYGPGSMAASVIITLLATVLLVYILALLWKKYWKTRKGKHLVLETDPEKGKSAYAFDNAGFTDPSSTPNDRIEKSNKSKWSQWSPLGALMTKNEKQKTVDDSALQVQEIKTVSLKSHDFTGLGFNIYGNMRDGIYIKDILHRGPASESGKLNLGDRIKSVTINFEHVVYEDALTILSYASPYEVVLEAQSGKMISNQTPIKTVQLGHPLYRSSSTTDLIQIQKTTKKRLFPPDDINTSTVSSPYSSLQKTRSTATTLERSQSPKSEFLNLNAASRTQASSPQHLKTQLEQKISQNHKQQLKAKDENPRPESITEAQKTENKYQKFGIKVLPVELKTEQPREQSPKSNELSQNDNNINLERHSGKFTSAQEVKASEIAIDEVDKTEKKSVAPPVKRREKANKSSEDLVQASLKETEIIDKTEPFVRQGSIGGSGIKRDKDGIPQEIPSHMLNAAVMARRNRRPSEDNTADDVKSPKKKGRAPAPPEERTKNTHLSSPVQQNGELKVNLDEIHKAEEINSKPISTLTFEDKPVEPPNYASDSDVETDNQSSVNTIELNASDITIHQTEDTDEIQNRRTASTGDLTKIQKTRKTSTGTLERAQSLDITDTSMPTLSKKRKGGSIEDNFDSKSGSDDSLYGKALVHKEPRLSLALDGLNTFQRSRLKKSTEWGNLEDAILSSDKDEIRQVHHNSSVEKSAEFDALVNKIKEIKQESDVIPSKEVLTDAPTSPPPITTNTVILEQTPDINNAKISEDFVSKSYLPQNQNRSSSDLMVTNGDSEKPQPAVKVKNLKWPTFENQNGNHETEIKLTHSAHESHADVPINSTNSVFITPQISEVRSFILRDEKIVSKDLTKEKQDLPVNSTNSVFITPVIEEGRNSTIRDEKVVSKPAKAVNLFPNLLATSESFLATEKRASNNDPFYNLPSKIYDTNVSDDIKVSRHSLGSLERPEDFKPLNTSISNISNITITNRSMTELEDESSSLEINIDPKNVSTTKSFPQYDQQENDELYTTALDTTLVNETLKNNINNDSSLEYERVSITSPTLIKDLSITDIGHAVTIEGPTSLTLEIKDDSPQKTNEAQLEINKPQISNKSFNISPASPTVNVHQEHSAKSNYSLTYITEIQVLTPNNSSQQLDAATVDNEDAEAHAKNQKFESYLKNFESNIQNFETHIQTSSSSQLSPTNDAIDPEKELHKIQEIAEEQLKKLPEMRFSTSSYESPKVSENCSSQIEQLRSNFEKPASKSPPRTEATKSRIPVATSKTPPTSPERRDSRNFDLEVDKEIVAIMSSPVHSTPIPSSLKYQPKVPNKNVSVTSIRSSSKIPSGFPSNRPPVPPRKYDVGEGDSANRVSTNGTSSSFKQWVFNPDDNTVTNITVTENKTDHK